MTEAQSNPLASLATESLVAAREALRRAGELAETASTDAATRAAVMVGVANGYLDVYDRLASND